MKLHLPKLLRNAVLACITAVAGISTTVGTAAFTGGLASFMLVAPQAQADYTWKGSSVTTEVGDAWKNKDNWEGLGLEEGAEMPGSGPCTVNSDMWNPITISDVTIGSAAEGGRVSFDGWLLRINLDNATLYANTGKLQLNGDVRPTFNVTNNSTLDLVMGTGSFHASNFVVGSGSTIKVTLGGNNPQGVVDLTGGGTMRFANNSASVRNVANAITLKIAYDSSTADSWGTIQTNLYGENVVLNNLSVDFGDGNEWLKTDVEITGDNYAACSGMYNVVYDETTGRYSVRYSAWADDSPCEWKGGELTWKTGVQFGDKVYTKANSVLFTTADADVVLGENLQVKSLTIAEGVTVSLDGDGHVATVAGNVNLDGSLVLKSAGLVTSRLIVGANGQIVLDAGAAKQWEITELPHTAENACQAPITVATGSLYLTSSNQTVGNVTVEDGAGLRLGGAANIGKLVLNGNGGWSIGDTVINAALYRNNGDAGTNFSLRAVELASDSTVQIDLGTVVIGGELTGGVLTKTGAGTLRLDGAVNNSGLVVDAGTLRWGGDSSDRGTNALNCDSVVINSGGTFQINHSEADSRNVAIVLNGGTLYSEDCSTNKGTGFKSLQLKANSELKYHWNGGMTFGELTGEGNISITGRNDEGGTTFKKVSDYHGTISSTLTRPLTIGTVNQSEGKQMMIDTAVTLQDFAKTGAGSLVVTGATTIQGSIVMNYEGTLTLSGGVNVAADTVLSYTGDNDKVVALGTLANNVAIDLYAVSDEVLHSGVNLGIALAEGDDVEALKEKLSVLGLDTYTITSKDGLAWLSSTSVVTTEWDKNWGASALAAAPATVAELEIASDATEQLLEGSATALKGGNNNAEIFGGKKDAAYTGDTWIAAKDTAGSYKLLVGGNYASAWQNSSAANFVGSSHIIVDGATVGTIIGGNHKDGYSASFRGDSYISVISGNVTAAIIGASTNAHTATALFDGNTNIFIYIPLAEVNGNGLGGYAPGDAVVGAGAKVANVQGTNTVTGNTNITIDLSGYTGEVSEFAKKVIGGHFNWADAHIQNIYGDTNVSIVGKEGIVFKDVIIGGSRNVAGEHGRASSINTAGTSTVAITGAASYESNIVGASYLEGNVTSKAGGAVLNLSGGTYSGDVVAGSYTSGTTNTSHLSKVGFTKLNISGGTYTTENKSVYGGSYLADGEGKLSLNSVEVSVSGGSIANLVGGHFIGGDSTGNVNATIGDITMEITGGEVQKLVGGSSIMRNNADATLNQGNIVIDLQGGTVGDVYAAGSQKGTTGIASASTKVTLGKDVSIAGGKTISGGYEGTTITSTITGDSTLVLSGEQNRGTINFKDFNKITNAQAATIGSLSHAAAVSKSGAGVLTLAGSTNNLAGGLTISEGGLKTAAALTLGGALTMADSTSLDVSGGALTLAGDAGAALTLGTGLTLTVGTLEAETTIISGVSSLVGYTGEVAASTYFLSVNGITDLSDYKVGLVGTDLKLIQDVTLSTDWIWEGDGTDGGEWGADPDGWEANSGTTAGQKVVFNGKGQGKVYIDGDVKADTITITAGEYSFEQKTDTSDSITASSLSISGAETSVTFKNSNTIAETQLKNGELVFSGAGSTGGNIVLGGGLLKFDSYTGEDISSKVSLATDYTGKVKIEVVDDANTTDVVESVTWEKAAWNGANSGVTAIFERGIEKSGDGTFNINWQYGSSDEAHTGAIVVKEGTLNMTGTKAGSPSLRFSGDIEVSQNAELNLELASGMTLNGNLTGKGKVTVGLNGTTGQHEINGDNSGFEGTITYEGTGDGSNGNRVSFKNAAAFGGANTTVVLNKRGFFFDAGATLSSTVKFIGSGNLMDGGYNTTYTFTGKILGDADAVWSSKDGVAMTLGLQGDLSAFAGTFTIGKGSTWILGGEGVASTGWETAGIVQTKIGGGGIATVNGIKKSAIVKTQYSNDTTLSGVISGEVNLQQSGSGTLILTAANTSKGTLTIDSDKKVQLGTADVPAQGENAAVAGVAGQWAGATLAGAGTLELVNGSLTSAMTNANDSTAKIAVNAAAGKAISLGNTSSAMLTSVKLAAGSTLTGVTGALTVGSAPVATNLRNTPAPVLTELNLTLIDANIGEGAAGTAMISGSDIEINDATKTTISFSTDDLIDTLKAHRDGEKESWLTLTDGKLTCNNSTLQSLALADTLATYGIRLDRVDGGSIVASGAVEDVYFVLPEPADTDPHTVDHYNTLGMYVGTVIEANQTLEIKLDGDNDTATKVKLSNLMGGTNSSLVVTNNKDTGVVTVELHNEAKAKTGENAPYDTIDAETIMEGSITGNKGTELVKAGTGTLVVKGKVVADELDIRAGALNLNNAENTVTTLNGTGGTLQLGSGSKLTVSGGSLAGVAIKAADGAIAAPTLDIDGDLALTGTSALTGLELDMSAGKKLSLAATTNDVVLLNGSGEVQGVAGTILSLDNTKAATYSGSFTGAGTLKVEKGGATFTLMNANAADWNVANEGNLQIDISGDEANPAPASLTLKDVTLAADSFTEFVVNTDADVVFNLTSLSTESGAAIMLTSTGLNEIAADDNGNIILGTAVDLSDMADGQTITLNGQAFNKFNSTATLANEGGNLVLKTSKTTENKYQALAESKNSQAGADLMWNASSAAINASPVLQRLNQQLGEAVTNGTSCEDLLAAVAGASNAVLGMAAHGDLDRQLQAIRNRTTTMGVDQSVVHDDMPYFNAWINAEGNSGELTSSETAGGYTLNSWGGTVGFDVDFTPAFTAGMALTAMYGDLSISGADTAEGDMNTYYVSAFARYCASAWTHTFVATVGLSDISLKRSVMGEDIDSTTDGLSFGLMYEVGHVIALDEDATACLQPVFNITWRHTNVNGYDEKGSDLALEVGNQTLDTVTLGLGARVQAVVGESMYNRTSIFEARVLAKFDIGDRRSTAEVGLAGAKAEIESAERGALGLEAGAGLTIPLGDDGGNLFMDAAVEMRADYLNVNGTIGYRINF